MKTIFILINLCLLGSIANSETSHEVDLLLGQGLEAESEKDFGKLTWTFKGKSNLLYSLDIEQTIDATINPKLDWDYDHDPSFKLDFYEVYFRIREAGLAFGVSDRHHLRFSSFIIRPSQMSLELLGVATKFHGEASFAIETFESQVNVYEKNIIEYLGFGFEGFEFGLSSLQGTNTSLMVNANLALGDFGLVYTEQNFIKENLTPQLGLPRNDAKEFEYKGLIGIEITISDFSQALYLEYCYNSTGYDSPLWTKTSPHIVGIRLQNQNTSVVSYSITTLFDTLSHGVAMANIQYKLLPQLNISFDSSLDLKSRVLSLTLGLNWSFKAEEVI